MYFNTEVLFKPRMHETINLHKTIVSSRVKLRNLQRSFQELPGTVDIWPASLGPLGKYPELATVVVSATFWGKQVDLEQNQRSFRNKVIRTLYCQC